MQITLEVLNKLIECDRFIDKLSKITDAYTNLRDLSTRIIRHADKEFFAIGSRQGIPTWIHKDYVQAAAKEVLSTLTLVEKALLGL